jgi:peptide-methionine (S)-S-oxide reductase
MVKHLLLWAVVVLAQLNGCAQSPNANTTNNPMHDSATTASLPANQDTITFGSGCFWCTEAIFQLTRGVVKVQSGYANGAVPNPTYRQVCEGTTGYAEVVQVVYDNTQVTIAQLLEVFWKTHDPTTLNRQGGDVGTQYRSGVYYSTETQHTEAEAYKKKLNAAGIWSDPLVTEIVPLQNFYPAEDYHQDYYNQNTGQGYCRMVITPKIEKFKQVFGTTLAR